MHTTTILRRAAAALAAALFAVTLAVGCGSSSSGSASGAASSAKAAGQSALANPTVSTELNQAEQALLTNIQAHFSAVHPVKSVEAGIQATYPNGSTSKILTFAVKEFTLGVVHPLRGANPVRDAWLLKVTNYAQSLGATPAASPATTSGVSALRGAS